MTCSGRSPGSRVITPPRLPGPCPKSAVAYRRRTHRLQLRAQLRIWPAIAESKPHRIPFADQYDQRPKHGHSKLTRAPCQGVKILAVLAATNLLKSALVAGSRLTFQPQNREQCHRQAAPSAIGGTCRLLVNVRFALEPAGHEFSFGLVQMAANWSNLAWPRSARSAQEQRYGIGQRMIFVRGRELDHHPAIAAEIDQRSGAFHERREEDE